MKHLKNAEDADNMSNEERAVEQLRNQFPFLEEGLRIQRERRISAFCPCESFESVFDYAVRNARFDALCTLTGLDDGDSLSVIYHLANPEGVLLNLRTSVPKSAPVIRTVTSWFPAADLYERELIDLLGFQVEGLPESGNRYPLTDDWPKDQHPLRKDWKVEMLQQNEGEQK